jgi:hypothetical protein
MKLGTLGLGAAALALAVAALALATRGGGQNTPAIVTVTEPSQIGALTLPSSTKPSPPVPAVSKPAPRAVHPSPARRCQSNSDESDPTGSDNPNPPGVCHRRGSNNNSGDDQAGDGKAGGA